MRNCVKVCWLFVDKVFETCASLVYLYPLSFYRKYWLFINSLLLHVVMPDLSMRLYTRVSSFSSLFDYDLYPVSTVPTSTTTKFINLFNISYCKAGLL